MNQILKVDLLLNGIKYKSYENKNILYSLYLINLLNIIIVHSLPLINIYNLINNFNYIILFKNILYLLNLVIIFYSNKLKFIKLISRYFDDIFLESDKNTYCIFSIAILAISLIMSILEVLRTSYDSIFYNYCLFFITFYSLKIRLSNLLYFQLIISEIYSIFFEYSNYLKGHDTDIINSINQFLEIRSSFNKLIFCFNETFSLIILVSYISTIYFLENVIRYKKFDLFLTSNSVYFITYVICFGYYLDQVSNIVDYLKSLICKSNNIRSYLSRKSNLYNVKNINSFEVFPTNEVIFKNYIVDIENGKSIDWLIFSNILNQDFKSFEIFGIAINNSNLISKLLSVSLILFLGFSRL